MRTVVVIRWVFCRTASTTTKGLKKERDHGRDREHHRRPHGDFGLLRLALITHTATSAPHAPPISPPPSSLAKASERRCLRPHTPAAVTMHVHHTCISRQSCCRLIGVTLGVWRGCGQHGRTALSAVPAGCASGLWKAQTNAPVLRTARRPPRARSGYCTHGQAWAVHRLNLRAPKNSKACTPLATFDYKPAKVRLRARAAPLPAARCTASAASATPAQCTRDRIVTGCFEWRIA